MPAFPGRLRARDATVDGCLRAYKVCARAEGKSPRTVQSVTEAVTYFKDFLGEDVDVARVTADHLRAFINALQQRRRWGRQNDKLLSPFTINHYVLSIKSCWSWLHSEGYVQLNPLAGVRVKTPQTVVPALSRPELVAILKTINTGTVAGFRNYVILLTLLDTGARVIKIEPPGGSPSRNIGPFYKDICHPEKSLFWMAYNLGKLGVTLNLETPDGKRILSALAKRADFVLESFQPGYMKGLGLGYDDLSRVNPRTIMVSITPYGQDGPKAQYKSSDLMNWASSGVLYVTGSPDRPPVTVGYPPQATMQAGVEGATAALIAHWYREGTGEGQHVDVSAQAANIMLLQALVETWDIAKRDYKRAGTFWVAGTGLNRNQVFPCQDGYVAFTVLGGAIGPANSTRALVKWMEEEGMAPEEIRKTDWLKFDVVKLTQQEFDRIEEPFKKFLLTKTKRELWERSFRDGIILAPLNTMADITQFSHTQERGMWVKVPHPELGEELTYWGPFARITGGPPITYRRRAPLIGEDNEAVYMGELGLSTEEMTLLKQAGTI